MLARPAILALLPALAVGQSNDVIDLARNAPPELFADAVIKLVETGKAPDAAQRRSLLIEAFEAAEHSQQRIRLVAMPGLPTDSRAGLRDAAAMLGLDAYSLESRIAALLAETDPSKARELFLSVEPPDLKPRPCEDPMIADASAYYEMAGSVAAQDLIPVLGRVNSPGELASFAKILGKANAVPPDEFRLLIGVLALKMEVIPADYRSFTRTADDLRQGLEGIAARARDLEIPLQPLAEGVRKMTIVQLSSPRCNEDFGDSAAFVQWFNRAFRGRLDPLSREETENLDYGRGFAKAESYFATSSGKEPTGKDIAEKFQKLRLMRGSAGWREALAEFLRDFDGWNPPGADIDIFHERMTVLHGLYQMIPPGDERNKVVNRAIDVLKTGQIERYYPSEWLLQARSFAAGSADGRTALLDALRASDDAGLRLFAALQSFAVTNVTQ